MDTKQQLIETYLALGSEKGFSNVSLSDIAAGVGIRKASIFSHFKSAQDLENNSLAFAMAELNNSNFVIDFKAKNIEALLVSLVNSFLEAFTAFPVSALLSACEQQRSFSDTFKSVSENIDRMINARIQVALEFCVQRSWTSIRDTDSASLIFSSAIRNLLTKKELPEWELDDFVKSMCELLG